MLSRIILTFLLFSATLLTAQVQTYETFEDFEAAELTNLSADTVYVVNFWATWCGPCIKELPYFEALNDKYKDRNVKLTLVSLDLPRHMDSKLLPFIEKNKLQSRVVLLADGKPNKWIDKVDPSWSGAIPITLFLNGDQKLFFEKEYHNLEELETDFLKLYKSN